MLDDLLELAFSVIPEEEFTFKKFLSRETNEIGKDVNTYDENIILSGSIQTVERKTYQNLGLDLSKNYITIYTTSDITNISRDAGANLIFHDDHWYEVTNETNWNNKDAGGYTSVMCVEVDYNE